MRFPLPRLLFCAALLATGCSSGPAPVDTRPYEQQIAALRRDKDQAFRVAEESPIPPAERGAFKGLVYYPIDPSYRVPANLKAEPSAEPVIIQLETSKGTKDQLRRVGTLGFALKGQPLKLTAFANVNARNFDQLFVPFGDLTNRGDTYGGGRYLQLQRTPTGLYDLDFNQAFNPYCVYNYAYECPVPPPENRLQVEIRAGEKMAGK